MAAKMVQTRHPGIFKRGSRYVVTYRVDGRQKKESARTLEEARALKRDRETAAARGELRSVVTKVSFGEACAEWLRYVEHDRQRRPSTLRDYRNVVNGYLLPEFGADTPLERVSTPRIEAYRERMLESHLSRRSVQKILVLLHGILKRAKRRGWIATNPAEDVERVSLKRDGSFNVLSPEQVFAGHRVG